MFADKHKDLLVLDESGKPVTNEDGLPVLADEDSKIEVKRQVFIKTELSGYEEKEGQPFTEEQLKWMPEFQSIHISNITCRGCHTAIRARGIEGYQCVYGIDIRDCNFVYSKVPTDINPSTAKLRLTKVEFYKDENSATAK